MAFLWQLALCSDEDGVLLQVFAGLVVACVAVQAAVQKKYLFTGNILDNDVSYMAHSNPFQCLAILAVTSALSCS